MMEERIRTVIRDVPDFPKPGIIFKDITPIMKDPELSNAILDELVNRYTNASIDAIAGIESRGFLFGYPLAMRLGVPFILIRKKGKLPYNKISCDYDLEYGTATIEIHTDAFERSSKVLIHDDLLATGGSAEAAARLIEKAGGIVAGFDFLVELEFLNGRRKLESYSENIRKLVAY